MRAKIRIFFVLIMGFIVSPHSLAQAEPASPTTSSSSSLATQKRSKKKRKQTKNSKKRAQKKSPKNPIGQAFNSHFQQFLKNSGLAKTVGKSSDAGRLLQCVQGAKKLQEIPKEFKALLESPGPVLASKFHKAWQASLKSLNRNLMTIKPPKSLEKMPKFAWDFQLKVIKEAGKTNEDMRVLGCIMASLTKLFKKAEPHLRKMAKHFEKSIQKRWEKDLRPMVTQKITKLIIDQLRQSDMGRKVLATTLRVSGKIVLATDKLNSLSKRLQSYQKALANPKNKQLNQAFSNLKKSLSEGVEPGRVIVLVTEELVQEEIEKVIDEKVGPLIDQIVTSTSSGLTVVNGVVDGACGFIPEVGAAVCTAFVTRVLRFSYDWVVGQFLKEMVIAKIKEISQNMVKYVGSVAYQVAFSKLDQKYRKIQKKYGPQFKQFARVIKPLVEIVKREALPAVNAINAQRKQLIAVLETANTTAMAK